MAWFGNGKVFGDKIVRSSGTLFEVHYHLNTSCFLPDFGLNEEEVEVAAFLDQGSSVIDEMIDFAQENGGDVLFRADCHDHKLPHAITTVRCIRLLVEVPDDIAVVFKLRFEVPRAAPVDQARIRQMMGDLGVIV